MNTYEEDTRRSIIENAEKMLKHYISLKNNFKNVDFWGDAFYTWDADIERMREIIKQYS